MFGYTALSFRLLITTTALTVRGKCELCETLFDVYTCVFTLLVSTTNTMWYPDVPLFLSFVYRKGVDIYFTNDINLQAKNP